jgi:hypothetical protein
VEDFDPLYSGGQGGRDYFTENNGYTWQWGILHDPAGLFEKMGGKAGAEKNWTPFSGWAPGEQPRCPPGEGYSAQRRLLPTALRQPEINFFHRASSMAALKTAPGFHRDRTS